MFQNGQDCPNAFGCEPIVRILRSKELGDAEKFNELVKEATGLLGLAKHVLRDSNLERRCAAGSSMEHDLNPGLRTLPHGRWDTA
eukprot:8286244-Pyramimonas_sp.AAC.1